jgi:hypothetical protein
MFRIIFRFYHLKIPTKTNKIIKLPITEKIAEDIGTLVLRFHQQNIGTYNPDCLKIAM